MDSADIATVAGLMVGSAAPSASSFGTSGPGSFPARRRPNRSVIWLAKMIMAMPEVKPTVTG